jgi:hypothetical protein
LAVAPQLGDQTNPLPRAPNGVLLAESEVFQNEILTGAESTENPAEKMPKSQDHSRNFIGTPSIKLLSKRLIPRVCEVLTRHNYLLGESDEVTPATIRKAIRQSLKSKKRRWKGQQ